MRLVSVIFSLSLLSCNQKATVLPNPNSTSIDVLNQPQWRTEPLDDTYIIQFPANYTGGVSPTIEGPEFSLQRHDQRAYLLGSTLLSAGTNSLANPYPDSLVFANWTLNRNVRFRRNGQTQGVFYYAQQPKNQGQLYLLRDGQLRFSLIVQYDSVLHQEVLGILQTIQPR